MQGPHGIPKLLFHGNGARLEHVWIVSEIKDVSLEERFLVVLELLTRYTLHWFSTRPMRISWLISCGWSTTIMVFTNCQIYLTLLKIHIALRKHIFELIWKTAISLGFILAKDCLCLTLWNKLKAIILLPLILLLTHIACHNVLQYVIFIKKLPRRIWLFHLRNICRVQIHERILSDTLISLWVLSEWSIWREVQAK